LADTLSKLQGRAWLSANVDMADMALLVNEDKAAPPTKCCGELRNPIAR